ncbi:MAG TPA: GNAT family N-acetyltransferase [Cellulomonas sp.]|nr:GNAT family N-acetyltransferase [Cellulomonas sp.]
MTERLVLVPQQASDGEWLAELFTARGGAVFSAADARERVAAILALEAEHGIGARVLRLRGSAVALGYVALVVGRSSVVEPELAYELLPVAHGRGYATEASRELLAAAFGTGRSRVWSTVRPWNVASLRVLEKLGFRRDRVTRDDAGEIVWLAREVSEGAGGVS